jgi:hypothetical protein
LGPEWNEFLTFYWLDSFVTSRLYESYVARIIPLIRSRALTSVFQHDLLWGDFKTEVSVQKKIPLSVRTVENLTEISCDHGFIDFNIYLETDAVVLGNHFDPLKLEFYGINPIGSKIKLQPSYHSLVHKKVTFLIDSIYTFKKILVLNEGANREHMTAYHLAFDLPA